MTHEDHFKSKEAASVHHLHSSSLLNNKNNSLTDMCNTPSFDKVSDFIDSQLPSECDREPRFLVERMQIKRDQKEETSHRAAVTRDSHLQSAADL